jgi:hypothetical protein
LILPLKNKIKDMRTIKASQKIDKSKKKIKNIQKNIFKKSMRESQKI